MTLNEIIGVNFSVYLNFQFFFCFVLIFATRSEYTTSISIIIYNLFLDSFNK